VSPGSAAGAAARRLAEAPVAPSAAQARELARRELSRRVYTDAQPGLLERAVRAVLDALGRLQAPAGSSPLRVAAIVLVLLLLAAAVLLAVRLTGRARRTRSSGAGPVLGDGARTAAQLRDAADEAAARGRWEDAVAERFRALVRGLQERDLLGTAPGLTADEAARGAALVLPEHAGTLQAAAALFDGVVYGHLGAAPEDAERLRALDAAVAGARPQLAVAAPGAAPGAAR
jgi:Domain of unknown function (DUF4129)